MENGGNKLVESETVHTYHPNNWLLTEVKTKDGGETTKTIRYRYDANGGQTGKKIHQNNELEHAETMVYNAFNQLSKVTQKDQTGAVALIAEYIYCNYYDTNTTHLIPVPMQPRMFDDDHPAVQVIVPKGSLPR